MKKIRLLINEDGTLSFGGPVREHKLREFLKKHAGRWFEGSVDDRESTEMRRYFEGPVSHAWFYINPFSGWRDFNEARENLKLEFNSYTGRDQQGNPVRYAKSTMMSSAKFQEFLDRVQSYFMDNGFGWAWPDPEDYKRWRDTHVDKGDEEYPPTKQLRSWYHKELGFDVEQ